MSGGRAGPEQSDGFSAAIGSLMELRRRVTDLEKSLDDESSLPFYVAERADELMLEAARLHGAVLRWCEAQS